MDKLTMIIVGSIVLVGMLVGGSISYYNNEKQDNINEEDISSYNIKNRYECNKIKDPEEYNKCLTFYLNKNPYKLGDQLVPIRTIE